MLELHKLCVSYGSTQVLWDVDLTVRTGEIVAVMGPNGSGKSTLFKAVMGIVRPSSGEIAFEGQDITRLAPEDHVAAGLTLVLERRRLFATMTVMENVQMGAYHRDARATAKETLEWVCDLFPVIVERRRQPAESLSGGEQQMVAIARGLMSRPRLMILDEPFLGLAPAMRQHTVALMRKINDAGVTLLFNEQNVRTSFSNADRGYVLEGGRVAVTGSGLEMLDHPEVRRVYLGEQES